jgi:hypothetical protein
MIGIPPELVSYPRETRAMLKTLRRTALLLSLAATLACAHKNPPPDFAYDHAVSFAGLKTFAWFDDPTWVMPQGNSIVDGQFVDRNVRQAVNDTLTKNGYVKVEKDANFYVAYHGGAAGVLSQDKWGVYSWWNVYYVDYAGTKYRKQSNLVLDIRDDKYKLIWRGGRTALIGTNPEQLKKDIDKAVALLLAQFPPKPGTEAK